MSDLKRILHTSPVARACLVIAVVVALLATLGPLVDRAEAKEPLVDFETGESLFTNIKARRVGDLITILITEESAAQSAAKTKANNKSETSGGPALGVLDFIKPWDMTVENKYKGDGDTQRRGSLQAEITARIVEVLPNGDLRLEGTRMININGEKQLIEITGTCRARDITPQNMILSTFVSDAQIAYNGSGIVNDTSDPGVVTKILNWLF
jgi:flagellar L-ring protein precursor FlgH